MPSSQPRPVAVADISLGWTSTFLRAFRAETIKLLSLRFFLVTATGTVLACVLLSWGLTALIAEAHREGKPENAGGLESGSAFLLVLHYGQIGLILLAAWTMHQEADAGSLRTTLVSVPRRSCVLAAKAAVVATGSLCVALPSVFGSAAIRCVPIDCTASGSGLAPDAVPWAILWGVVVYWLLISIFTFALAVILRSGLTAMATVLALALIVSTYLLHITPLAKALPDQAGAQLYQLPPVPPGDLGPIAGGLILLAWSLAALLLALIVFRSQPVRG